MSGIVCADAAAGLKTLPPESVQMCVTSPPYYGLRDYGTDGQIGIEQTPQEYITRLLQVFAEVHRVLKNDGTLWINISDSYAGSGKGIGLTEEKNEKSRPIYGKENSVFKMSKEWENIKPKDMIGIPWMLAFALRDYGYYLRSDIIWHKINCLPESVKDRPVKSYEHIFLLSKSPKYYYDYAAIQEPIKEVTAARYMRGRSGKAKYSGTKTGQGIDRCGDGRTPPIQTQARRMGSEHKYIPDGRAFRDVPGKTHRAVHTCRQPEGGHGIGSVFRQRNDGRGRKAVRQGIHRDRDQSELLRKGAKANRGNGTETEG